MVDKFKLEFYLENSEDTFLVITADLLNSYRSSTPSGIYPEWKQFKIDLTD